MKRIVYAIWLAFAATAHAAPHKTITCGALITTLQDLTLLGSERQAHAYEVSRAFHLFQSQGFADVKAEPGFPEFFMDEASGRRASKTAVAARLQGIKEKNLNENDIAVLQSMSASLHGYQAIEEFRGMLATAVNLGHAEWQRRYFGSYLPRILKGTLFAGSFYLIDYIKPHSGFQLMGPAIVALTQYESLTLQFLFADQRFSALAKALQNLDQRRIGQTMMWSKNYKIGRTLKSKLLQTNNSHADYRSQLAAYDAHADDRGYAGYVLGSPGGTPNRLASSGPASWVGVDVLLTWKGDEPRLSILLRHSDNKPRPRPAPETEKAKTPSLVLVPTPVTGD